MARIAVLLVLLLATSFAFAHANDDGGKQQRTLTVIGQGSVTVEANIAQVFLGVEVRADTATAALQQAAEQLANVIDFLEDQPEVENLSTAFFTLQPIVNEQNQIVGFVAINIVSFTVSNIERVGAIIDGAVAAGANRIDFIAFLVSEEDLAAAQALALERAVENAGVQAEAVLAALNLEPVKVLNVQILFVGGGFAAAQDMAQPTPILPGQQIISAAVQITILFRDAAETAFFLVLILAASLASFTHAEEWEWKQTVTLTGTGIVGVEADDAKVFLGVEVFAKTARQAQEKAAFIIARIVNFLKNVDDVEDIETAFFDIRPVIKYNKLAGFVAVHILSFKVKDVEKLGFIVDGAIYAGANRVDFIKFLVDKDDFKEAQEEALEKALKDIERQFDDIADALGLEFEKVLKVEVVSVDIIKGKEKFGSVVDWWSNSSSSSSSSSFVKPEPEQFVKAVVRITVKVDDDNLAVL
ncbi:hypothetical protein QOT17_023916 [Balamuthia mandrillaris]